MTHSVLLLDDDEDLRALMAPALVQQGYQVIEARSIAEARNVLANQPPSVMVVDGVLPDGSGIEFIKSLRDEGARIPIIFMSIHWREDPTFELLTRTLQVTLVLHKPLAPEELLAGVRVALGPEQTGDTSADAVARTDSPPASVQEYRRAYGAGLPRKLSDLGALITEALESPQEVDLLRKVGYLAHKLHSTAGSYGYHEVSLAAARIEETASKLLERQEAPDRETWSEIAAGLGAATAAATWTLPPETLATEGPGPEERARILYPRVLVVDDDPSFQSQVQLFGRNSMIEVVSALSEQEALSLAHRAPPDLVVLDIHMGENDDAFRLCRLLRSMVGGRRLPIAFISVDHSIPNRIVAAQAGGSLFLTKPLTADEFVGAIRQLTGARRETQQQVLVADAGYLGEKLTEILSTEGHRITTIRDPRRVLEALDDELPDLLLVNAVLPHMSGFDLCRMLRASLRWRDLPIILVALETTPAMRAAAFEAGADDYLADPIVTEELLARVRALLERRRLLRERSDRDILTGLLYRRAFLDALGARLAEAERNEQPLALALLDLDSFKRVNDSFGHLAGDRVLAGLGQLLSSRFRAEDLRCRWGGEEFILVLVGETRQEAALILQRTLEEFRDLRFSDDHGDRFQVTFSAGVAAYPADGRSGDQLIRVADGRLYAAKARGGDCIEG